MTIDFKKESGKVTIIMEGRLDTTTVQYAEDKVLEEVKDVNNIVFDFSELAYISSAGLRLLLELKKSKGANGGSVEIIGCNDDVREIFAITGFDSVFNLGEPK